MTEDNNINEKSAEVGDNRMTDKESTNEDVYGEMIGEETKRKLNVEVAENQFVEYEFESEAEIRKRKIQNKSDEIEGLTDLEIENRKKEKQALFDATHDNCGNRLDRNFITIDVAAELGFLRENEIRKGMDVPKFHKLPRRKNRYKSIKDKFKIGK